MMNRANNKGYTMLELMLSISLLSIIVGALWVLADSLDRTSKDQESVISTQGEVTGAMMRVSKELRNAAFSSMNWVGSNTSTSLTYQIASDVDGNGTAVDAGGNLELGAPRTIQRDTADANNDGRTDQLILINGGQVSVLANNLKIDEDTNNNGVLDNNEDTNFNNQLDRGILFTNTGTAIQVTIQAQRQAGPQSRPMISTMVETINPRN